MQPRLIGRRHLDISNCCAYRGPFSVPKSMVAYKWCWATAYAALRRGELPVLPSDGESVSKVSHNHNGPGKQSNCLQKLLHGHRRLALRICRSNNTPACTILTTLAWYLTGSLYSSFSHDFKSCLRSGLSAICLRGGIALTKC